VTSRTLQRLDEKQLRLGWIMRDFAPGIQAIERGQIPAAPLQIEVHPYYGGQPAACNYRCAWCTRLEDKLALKSDGIVGIAPDRLIAFIASLKDTGVRRLVLSGNSTEPLLYPRIGEVLQTIHASGMSWVLYTNFRYGANIIDAAVDYARRGDLLRVSLDAGNERSYLRTHRPRNDTRAFQAVIANLEKLLAVRALRKSPLTVGVAYLMTEVNSGEEELREAIERGMSMGVDFMRFSVPLKPTHQNPHFALAEAEARRIRSRISRLALEYLGRPDWTGDCPKFPDQPIFQYRRPKVGRLCSMSFWHFCDPCSLDSDPIPGSCLKTWRSAINLPCSDGRRANPNSDLLIDCFGLASGASGQAGDAASSSSSPRPSSLGIALAFAFSGAGNPDSALEDPPPTITSSL